MKRFLSHWAFFSIASSLCFAAMAAFVRVTAAELPRSEVIFFRNFISMLLLLPVVMQQHVRLKTSFFRFHLLRTASGLSAMALYFYAISNLPLAGAVLLNYTSPIFVAVFASLWLREILTRSRKLAVGVGVVGVLCLFQPTAAIASWAGLAGLASGVLGGLALTTVKRLAATDPGTCIVLYFSFLSSIVSALPMFWVYQAPSWPQLLLLLGMACVGTAGQLLLTHAYKLAPASQVSPLSFVSLVFAAMFGFLFWGETPDVSMLIGTALIVFSGVLVVRERTEPMPTPPSAAPEFPAGQGAEPHPVQKLAGSVRS